MSLLDISTFIARWPTLALAPAEPWRITQECEAHIRALLERLGPDFRRVGD
ncbi:hypothetical protein [Pseudomonas oryzihabitans]|uniref:hypothetical protein n=1 Tax=Pseudomonas oryzihabitans TaxID=47885 RepID=UPI003211E93D